MSPRLFALLLALGTSSCVIALDLTEEDAHEARRHLASHGRHVHLEGEERRVLGRVVDAAGEPVHARVAAVYPSGSYSTSGEGDYELGPLPRGRFNLKVSDEEGRVAVLEGLAIEDDECLTGVDVTLAEPGATVSVSFQGGTRDAYRVACFHDGERVEDFTLRRDRSQEVVLPAGRVPMQLYDGEAVWSVRDLRLEPGASTSVVFELEE